MIDKLLAIIIAILLVTSSFGQSTPDSIQSILDAMPPDSNKVLKLVELSRDNCIAEPELALQFAEDARILSDSINFRKGVALAYKYEGMVYYVQAKHFETISLWEESYNTFHEINDLGGVANMLNNIGAIYFNQGLDLKAIEYYLASLEAAEQVNDTIRILTALANIGAVFSNKEQTWDKALKFYFRAMVLTEAIGDLQAYGTITVNMGQVFLEKYQNGDTREQNLDSALHYFEKSFDAFDQLEGSDIPYTLNYIGMVYAEKGDFNRAISYQQEAISIARDRNSQLVETHAMIGLAKTYELQGNTEAALNTYREVWDLAREINARLQMEDILSGLSKTYARINNYKYAYEFQMILSEVKDSIYNAKMDKAVERMQLNADVEKKQNEINILTVENEVQSLQVKQQRIMKNAFLGGLVLIMIIAFVLYRNFRIKAKSNKLLGAQKLQIENLLLNILPAKVAQELQLFGFATPRYYESASVLFTDFKEFSKIAEGLSPNELVTELNEFFVAFDGIIEKYGLEKIKTIGDAYMCAGGIPTETEDHPLQIVKAGLDMQEYMLKKNEDRVKDGKIPWGLRIGVHTGPVVAGVVGRKKYAYDIWGSTVNISSRMESNGEAGKLNISSVTHELIKDHYECEYRGKIYAKNIGDIDMYFVGNKTE